MNLDRLLSLLADEISGIRAKESVAELERFHRIQASPGYDEAIGWLAAQLAKAGIEHQVHDYPADGRSKTYQWVSPPAWTVRSASLWLGSPKERLLASFEEIPQLVAVHSPGGAVSGELVHVECGLSDEDYAGLEVSGKMLLASGRASEVLKQAGGRGAVGLVVYPDSERAAASHDLVQYQGIFPTADEIPGLVPTFSISRRMADRLLRALRKGPVQLTGEIDAEFTTHPLRVLEARIPGMGDGAREVLLSAHVCHPRHSANDNASGSAVLLELARAFRVAANRAPLRCGLRLVWVPEFYGTLPWAAQNAELLARCHFALNLDMVGPSPKTIGEPLRIFRTTNHVPSYINGLIEPLASRVAAMPEAISPHGSDRPLHWILDRPTGGSDHLVFAASPHRLPALMLGHDDPYWHTNLDTPDNVDSTRMKHVALLAGALAGIPSLDAEEHPRLVDWVYAYSVRELAGAVNMARGMAAPAGVDLLDVALRVERERLSSLAALGIESTLWEPMRRLLGGLADQYLSQLPEEGKEAAAPRRSADAPRRIVDGPLVYSITDRLDVEELTFFKESLSANHRALIEGLLNLCDGTRTPKEIALRLTLDIGSPVQEDTVERGLALLRKVDAVA